MLLRAVGAPVEASATEYSPVKAPVAESMLASRPCGESQRRGFKSESAIAENPARSTTRFQLLAIREHQIGFPFQRSQLSLSEENKILEASEK